jgi:hypothetical protein
MKSNYKAPSWSVCSPRTMPTFATSLRCGSPLALRMAEVAIRLDRLFESLTSLDAGCDLAGLRVCVRWLPIEGAGRHASLIDQPLVHLLAVLTNSAIGTVDTEPTYDFIPKYEIIWTSLGGKHA